MLAAFIFLKLWWYCLLTKLPFFYRVKLWNVVDMQNFLQVLAISIMKCGTRRAAKYWIVIMIQTGERKVIRCPKRRKGRSYKKKLSIVWKAVETVRAKYDPGLISYSRFQYTQGYSEAQLLYFFFKSTFRNFLGLAVLQFYSFSEGHNFNQRSFNSTSLQISDIQWQSARAEFFFKNFKLTSQVRVYFMAIFRHW